MKIDSLVACDWCHYVFTDGIFPSADRLWRNDAYGGQEKDPETNHWNGEEFIPKTKCPNCGEDIIQDW